MFKTDAPGAPVRSFPSIRLDFCDNLSRFNHSFGSNQNHGHRAVNRGPGGRSVPGKGSDHDEHLAFLDNGSRSHKTIRNYTAVQAAYLVNRVARNCPDDRCNSR
jgi:hypothetical protein